MHDEGPLRRGPNPLVPLFAGGGWLSLSDDDLLYQIERLGDRPHDHDQALLEVMQSDRHFFIRQEAAKKIRDRELLKAFAADRHIGQILVRKMTRAADVAYLRRLRDETRYLEVRKAAVAQLQLIAPSQESEEAG